MQCEDTQKGRGAQDMGSEGDGAQMQKAPSLTMEKITKGEEREETKAIETLEEEKLEHSADPVLNAKKEESVGKDHSSTRGPNLTI
ncbi:hypothetical protein KI387_030122, partial [Taxus chinensis]